MRWKIGHKASRVSLHPVRMLANREFQRNLRHSLIIIIQIHLVFKQAKVLIKVDLRDPGKLWPNIYHQEQIIISRAVCNLKTAAFQMLIFQSIEFNLLTWNSKDNILVILAVNQHPKSISWIIRIKPNW